MSVSNFFYENPKTGHPSPLEVWLGDIGPLQQRVYQASSPVPLTNISPFHGNANSSENMVSSNAESANPDPSLATPGPPRYVPTGQVHTGQVHSMVVVEMPTIAKIIEVLQAEVKSQENNDGQRNHDEANGSGAGDGNANEGDGQLSAIAGRSLPLLFIRGADGIGYHSGRTIACENVFQGLDLSNPGANAGSAPAGTPDAAWLAAAQAAATADGGLHGWTLRIL